MPKIKKRVSKKPSATEADVKNKLISIKDSFKSRQKTALKFGAGILIICIAIASFFLYYYFSQKKAKTFEYEAYKIYYNDYQKSPLNKEERYKDALDLFKKAYDNKKTPLSLFYISACYYELGKYDDALKTLKDFIKTFPHEDSYLPLVYQKMAVIYIKKGDNDEAMKTLDTLMNLKNDIYKDFALMEYGRLFEKEGKSDDAKKKFKELVTRFPDSPFIDEAKAKLSEEKKS
jgi:predicted negative regulator of RcsB-dependent stress response